MSYARWTTLLILALYVPGAVLAQTVTDISLIPVVIDEKTKPRDIVKQSITVSNRSDHKIELYPSVNDVHPEQGEQEFVSAQDSTDREASLSNWIELSRGVIELGPGEIKTIPFVIRVTANAIPGMYHADVSFSVGSTREEAEAHGKVASVMVNLEVKHDVKEILQLNKFTTDTLFFAGDDVLFNYQLENLGNQELNPKGEIRIYNRKGEEVAAVEVNKDGKVVTPDQVAQLASVWNAARGFGKYKAFLTVNYGSSQTASVQDTVFFWVVPWQQLLVMFIVALGGLIFFGFRFEKWFHDRHVARMAPLGSVPQSAYVSVKTEPVLPVVAPALVENLPKVSIMSRALSVLSVFAPKGQALPEVQDKEVPVVPREEMVVRERPSVQEAAPVPVQTRAQNDGGHTIDLKSKTSSATFSPPKSSSNHVINLKL